MGVFHRATIFLSAGYTSEQFLLACFQAFSELLYLLFVHSVPHFPLMPLFRSLAGQINSKSAAKVRRPAT
jgi:hypothetical protein